MENKYQKYLADKDSNLDKELFNLVSERKFEEAYGVAMRIKAIYDIKFALSKLDKNDKQPIH